MFKIKVLDTFITESQKNGKEISYENFSPINESYSIGKESVNISEEIFEAYMKYADVTGTEMATLNEFEKIKSFAEFIQDKEAESDVSTDEPAADTSTDEPAAEPSTDATEEPSTDATEEPAADAEPSADAGAEPGADAGDGTEDPEKKEEDDLGLESKANEEVQIQPEKVAPQAEEKKDDERHQTKVDLVTTDGKATAAAIEDKKMKDGEPEKASAGDAGEKEGEHLEDATTNVAPVKESEELEDEGASMKTQKGENDDPENGITPPLATTDGQKTAAAIEDKKMKDGEPEKASAGDAGEKEGEHLEGEPVKVKPVSETAGEDIGKVDDPEEEIANKERLEDDEIEKQKNPVAESAEKKNQN